MKELFPLKSQKGFPGGSEVKASACNAEDLGLIPAEIGWPCQHRAREKQVMAKKIKWDVSTKWLHQIFLTEKSKTWGPQGSV